MFGNQFSLSRPLGFAKYMAMLMAIFSMTPAMAGPGTFDSLGGTYDANTKKSFEKTLYLEARTKTFVGSLSRSGVKHSVAEMYAGDAPSLDGSAAIVKRKIDSGDEMTFTMQDHMRGTPTYGDLPFKRGDYLGYKNLKAYVNLIKTPAIPVQGEMAQQRVRDSITNIPAAVRKEVVEYMAEQIEAEAIIAMLYGASPSALLPTASGGLGVSLGVGSGSGAGVPLMPINFFCNDNGWSTYNTTPATHNAAVNTLLQSVTATADEITLIAVMKIRRKLDQAKFKPVHLHGKKYKAICLMDPEIWYRLAHLLKADQKDAMARAKDNPIFGVDYQLEYKGILWCPVQNLEKFRLGYQADPAYPTIGPGMTADFRDYTTSSSIGLCLLLGAGALYEGYNGELKVVDDTGYMKEGLEVAAKTKDAFIRGEWFAKDGRTDATSYYCDSFAMAAFYEPGIGTDWA